MFSSDANRSTITPIIIKKTSSGGYIHSVSDTAGMHTFTQGDDHRMTESSLSPWKRDDIHRRRFFSLFRQTQSAHRISKSLSIDRQLYGHFSLHRSGQSGTPVSVGHCVSAIESARCVSSRWFANSMDLTSLTSSIINIPLSRHVHNHSIGCTATNSIGTTNTSIRLLIRCRSNRVFSSNKDKGNLFFR